MKFDAASSIWLNRTEQSLIVEINQGHIPFLGGYLDFLSRESTDYFRKKILNSRNPLQTALFGLKKWPAVFATYLTSYVVEGYGRDNHAAVWPHLDNAVTNPLCKSGLDTNNNREMLWKGYRAACISIGLPVLSRKSGNQYMVNEFLHQAGVPLKYMPELAQKMAMFSSSFGLPEENDSLAIKQWRLSLLDYIRGMQKPVVRALETDDTDYYPNLFLHHYEQRDRVSSNRLEKSFIDSIKNTLLKNALLIKKIKKFKAPTVIWRDENICIELPASEDKGWEIQIDKTVNRYGGLPEAQVVAITEVLPCKAKVKNLHSNQIWSFKLWGDDKNNRFLLFNERGALVESSSLVQDILHIEPGNYYVLSRFVPNKFDECHLQEVSPSPKIYYFVLNLAPGESKDLAKGPVTIKLQADSKPILSWEGSHIKGVRGNELFASENLSIQFQIPEELHGDPRTLFIRLTPGNEKEETIMLPINIADSTKIDIPLESVCNRWSPGVMQLTASVLHEGGNRSLVRTSVYLWNGLKTIKEHYRFAFTNTPNNLNTEDSQNIKITETHLTFKDSSNRFFRSVFNLDYKKNRIISFTWVVPGTFLFLEEYTEKGIIENPLTKNSIVSVSEKSRKALKIYSDASGLLSFGTFSQYYDFNHSLYKRIPLLSLIEYITPESNTLSFKADDCNESEILLRLSSPQFVEEFHTDKKDEDYRISFTIPNFAEEIDVSSLELLKGKQLTDRIIANDPKSLLFSDRFMTFSNELVSNNQGKHVLEISLANWDPGAWIFSFSIKIDGRWYNLSNERGDVYAAGFVFLGGGILPVETIFFELNNFIEEELIACFKRTHIALLDCYSEQSWDSLEWLKKLWVEVGERLDLDNTQTLIELLRVSVKQPNESIASGWIPICSLKSHFLRIYALPATRYQHTFYQRQLMLQSLNLISGFTKDLTQLFMEGTIFRTAAAGFSNFPEMQRGKQPKDFCLANYKEALSKQDLRGRIRLLNQEDWYPAEGEYLGCLHYLYSIDKLKRNYHQTLGDGATDSHSGNPWRRGMALRLAKELSDYKLHDFASGVPTHWMLRGTPQNLGLLYSEINNADQQEVENLQLIVASLSLLAQVCRWDSRSPGALDKFIEESKYLLKLDSERLELILGYLLFVGEDVFSFYLLLWEFLTKAEENQS